MNRTSSHGCVGDRRFGTLQYLQQVKNLCESIIVRSLFLHRQVLRESSENSDSSVENGRRTEYSPSIEKHAQEGGGRDATEE